MDQATAANVLSGLIFIGFVYYVMYIPIRDKKDGIESPSLFARIKRDILALVARFKK